MIVMQPTRPLFTCPRRAGKRRSRVFGFTLVEMLVVISIIAILAALLIPTVGRVMRQQRTSAISIEITNLAQAVEAYKLKNKDYPPDFSNVFGVQDHMKKAFPRNQLNVAAWLTTPPAANQLDPRALDPSEALVFWLGGGLKKNQRNPIRGTGEKDIYFEFKTEQLVDSDGDGWMEYTSEHSGDAPYVYFDGRILNDYHFDYGNRTCTPTNLPAVCAYAWAVYPPRAPGMGVVCVGRNVAVPDISPSKFGVVRPYRTNTPVPANDNTTHPVTNMPGVNDTTWINPGKFQIISAGLDEAFGTENRDTTVDSVFKSFPVQNYYTVAVGDLSEDADNIANFTEGQTIEEAIP